MLEKAVCVWLKADLAVIHRRVSCRRTRPQLFEGDSMHILEELLKERSAIYPQAHVSVTSHEETHDVTVDRVIEALNQLGGQAVSVG